MTTLPVYVGLGYHNSTVQVCVLDSNGKQLGNAACPNDAHAIGGFVERLHRPVRAANLTPAA